MSATLFSFAFFVNCFSSALKLGPSLNNKVAAVPITVRNDTGDFPTLDLVFGPEAPASEAFYV